MTPPRLLDLFCGAGGAAMGYHRAGFEVVGVDLHPQPRYPFEFHKGDALTYPLDGFDAIHASPPCQHYSTMTRMQGPAAVAAHPSLIGPTRTRLLAAAVPWVIENVAGARSELRSPAMLCGSMFGLQGGGYRLRRHRLFESGLFLWPPGPCSHVGQALAVYGHPGGSSSRDRRKFGSTADWREGMGIGWMTNDELAQAIPPAFTEWIGRQLLAATS